METTAPPAEKHGRLIRLKYGESAFDILYLAFAIVSGCVILRRARDAAGRKMGLAALILGCGDAFHLVPRVLNYFVTGVNWTAALGVGKLVTSITMTVFYVLMYRIRQDLWAEKENRGMTAAVWGLTLLRTVLCLFPQNAWLENGSDPLWGTIRNIPFVILGALVCLLYFRKRGEDRRFRLVWLYILLSFLFYIPVAVAAGLLPILGMLMLPKTVCYILLILVFLRYTRQEIPAA